MRDQNLLSERPSISGSIALDLHTGEIYVNGDDILGQGVHLRLASADRRAPANGVAFRAAPPMS